MARGLTSTKTGTVLVKDIQPAGAEDDPEELTSVGGALFFEVNDGVVGRELWKFQPGADLVVTNVDPRIRY